MLRGMLPHPAPSSPARRARILTLLVCLGGLLISGCGGKSTAPGVREDTSGGALWPGPDGLQSARSDCDVPRQETQPGGSFTVALTQTIQADRAPVPHNAAERVLFAQLYETLVQVTCEGKLRPGLATHWTCTADSSTWVFTLRDGARLWDGTRITPQVVKEAWTANQDCPRERSTASPWSWFNARSKTVTVVDARRLAIQLPEPQNAFPLLLAHPATAVALPRPGWQWPVGSGPARLRATTPAALPLLECRPNPHHPDHPAWDKLTFLIRPGADPRDLVGADCDLLMVRQLDTVRFFEGAPGFQVRPLPWDRLYLLVVSPDRVENPPAWKDAVERFDPSRELTGVTGLPWSDLVYPSGPTVTCPQLAGPVTMGRSARREWDLPQYALDARTLVFNQDDPGAREMAHRLSALAGGTARAVGLPEAAGTFSLDWQMAGAHLVRLDQSFPSRCLQTAVLLGKASWLQKVGLGVTSPPGTDSLAAAEHDHDLGQDDTLDRLRSQVVPVAITRPWLITRGDVVGWSLAYDGTLLLGGLGRTRPSSEGDRALP